MTVLFMGGEREALVQASGTTTEGNSAGYYDSAVSRGYVTLEGSGATYLAPFSASSDDVWLHMRRRQYGFSDGSAQATINFRDASNNVLARLRNISSGNYGLEYWDGSSFVGVPGSPNPGPAGVMHVYDVHIVRHASAGIVEWYYDGALIASATGLNTASYGTMTNIQMVWVVDGGGAISEVVVTDADPTIGWKLTTFPPTGDGTDTDGTGTYADVDELVTSTADFIALDTAGQHHSFTKGTHSYLNEISGVAIAAQIRVADGTGPQQIKPYVKIGGTRYYGTTFALTNGFVNYRYVWLQDPSTLADWDYLDVGSDTYMEFGWEAVA